MPRRFLSEPLLVRVVAIVGIGISIALSINMFGRLADVWAGDYQSYAAGASRVLNGEALYPEYELSGPFGLGSAAFGVGFVYPPPAVLPAIPFAVLGEPVGFEVFWLLSAIGLGVAVYLVGRREGLRSGPALVLTLAVMLTAPAVDSICTGQANTFVALGLAMAWLVPAASGYVGVVGGLIKIYPGALLAWAARNHSPIGRPIGLAIAILAASLVLQGPALWADFLTTLRNGVPSLDGAPPAPRHVLALLVGPTGALALALAMTVALLLIVLWAKSPYIAFAAQSMALILPAPDWHLHYLLVPLIGVLPAIARWIAGLQAERSVSKIERGILEPAVTTRQ